MATEVIHEHDTAHGDGSGMAIGVVLLALVVIFLFYVFGSGLFRGTGGTNVQVPGTVDVNLNQGGK